jgi:hypothetical protein
MCIYQRTRLVCFEGSHMLQSKNLNEKFEPNEFKDVSNES